MVEPEEESVITVKVRYPRYRPLRPMGCTYSQPRNYEEVQYKFLSLCSVVLSPVLILQEAEEAPGQYGQNTVQENLHSSAARYRIQFTKTKPSSLL